MPKKPVSNPLFNSVNFPLTTSVLVLLFMLPLSLMMVSLKSLWPKMKELEIFVEEEVPVQYCGDVPDVKYGLTLAENGESFQLAPGDKIALTLEENSSTGYSWQFSFARPDDGSTADLKELCYTEERPSPTPSPSPVPVSCTDSDGGRDYYIKGTVVYGGTSVEDYCTDTNLSLHEKFCGAEGPQEEVYRCRYGCTEGACAREGSDWCTDTDGGRNYYVKGTACDGPKCSEDMCQDSVYLMENDCGWAGGIPTQDGCGHNGLGGCRYECPEGCTEGACVQSTEPPSR